MGSHRVSCECDSEGTKISYLKAACDGLAYEHKCRLCRMCKDLVVLQGDPHINQITRQQCLPTPLSKPGTMQSIMERAPPIIQHR